MTEFRFPPVLSIAAWEAEIDAPSGPPAGDRPGGLTRGGPHLDFGRVEYVELDVLARALLVLDAAVAAGVGATVTLPAHELEQGASRHPDQLADPDDAGPEGVGQHGAAGSNFGGSTGGGSHGTGSDGAVPDRAASAGVPSDRARSEDPESWSRARQTRHRAGRRGQVRAFMRQAGFQEAPHWPADAVRVRGAGSAGKGEDVDELPSGDVAAGRNEPAVEPMGYRRRVLPLQWLQPLEGASVREPARYVALEQGLGDLGLPASDARAIGETVLAELIENAAKLAATHDPDNPRVLVGGQLLDHDSPPPLGRPADYAVTTTTAGPDEGGSRVLRLFAGGGGRPDTLFEATVPVGPRFSAPSGHWSGHPALHRPHRLGWIGAALDPEQGLGTADRAAFAAAIGAAAASRTRGGAAVSGTRTSGVVVTVSTGGDAGPPDFGPDDFGSHEFGTHGIGTLRQAVRRTLAALAPGTERAAVAAVFPDLTWQILESCVVAGLEVGLPAPGGGRGAKQQSGRPMLVLGSQGRSLWYGGSAPTRAVLDLLTRAGGVAPLVQAREIALAAGAAGDEFEKLLRNNKQLCTAEGGNLVLLLSPLQVLSALTDAAQRELGGEVLRGGSGVRSGLFRTPTLAVTNRWIDVGRLLDGTIGFDVAAFALARAVQAELAALPPSRTPVVVAQTHTCPPRLAGQLSECLALGDRTYPAGSELDQGGWPTAGDVPCDARVVLCADAILTENTVRRAIADIVECAEPVVIACVVDARVNRGRIKVLNREIPVVALAEIDLRADSQTDEADAARPVREPARGSRGLNERDTPVGRDTPSGLSTLNGSTRGARQPILDIDPLSLRPLPPRTPEQLPISEEELLYWCAPHAGSPSGALRLGHVEYARRVHASAAADVDRLFRNEDARTRITDVLLDTIQRSLARVHHHADPTRPEDAIQIWHPGSARGDAGRLAHAAWSRLVSDGHRVNPPLAFQRPGVGSAWLTAPAALDRALRPRTVLILDYVARTGSTLQQLIRHAVSAGAERIVAIVLLDQLPERERGLLGSVSAVSAEAVGARTMRGSDVPVVVRYISATSIGGDDAHECGICATREKYADFGDAPERLRRHAGRLHELLRARRRDELFESAPADLFGVPLLGDDATDYLRWRGLLRRALYDTGARLEVMDRLAGLTQSQTALDASWGRRALTRLLAAERGWLRLPPLRYAAARELVARYCLDELGSPAPEPPWLRAQTVMVLAAAAPHRFVTTLPTLIELGADEPVVVDQVCLEAYRLARRPRRDSAIDLAQLRDGLARCRDQLERSHVGWDQRLVEDYAHVVRQLVFLTELPPRPRLNDPRDAWARLGEQWCGPAERHRFESKLLRVRDFVEDLQLGAPTRERTAAAEADLRECARLVEERVLAYVPPLREILAGEYVAELFGRGEQERFVALAGTSAAGLLDLSERLGALLREPRSPDSMQWRSVRRELLDRISWWYNALFATHRPVNGAPALLVDLVSSAPTSVAEVVKSAVAARGLESATQVIGELDAQVFCPRELLDRAIGQVLDDVLARDEAARNGRAAPRDAYEDDDDDAYDADPTANAADREPSIEIGLRRPSPDAVQLVVRDTAVLPGPADPGRCVGPLARGLKPFGGWLTGRALAAEGWSFESVIALRPWQGV